MFECLLLVVVVLGDGRSTMEKPWTITVDRTVAKYHLLPIVKEMFVIYRWSRGGIRQVSHAVR